MVSHTVSAPCAVPVTRSKTCSAPGAVAASPSVSTRADAGAYQIRRPPANHSAAGTRASSWRDPLAVFFVTISGLPVMWTPSINQPKQAPSRCLDTEGGGVSVSSAAGTRSQYSVTTPSTGCRAVNHLGLTASDPLQG